MIVETLRRALFDHPSPPEHRAADFASLEGLMFPARSEFQRLLDSRDSQTQIESAKNILLALAYESAVFPPNKFIRNLLDFESHVAGEAGGGSYVARDHFLHLVHLYLIGLYAFWYHGPIHKKVCDELRRLLPQGERHKPAVLRAAVAAWRSFVLFHDLAYPWEASQQVADAQPYLAPFTQAHEYAAKDAALFALSQLIALEWIMSEEYVLLGEVIDDLPPPRAGRQQEFSLQPRDWPEERERLENARRIPRLPDRALLRLVQQIVKDSRLVPVLENIVDELPCASGLLTFDQFLRSRGLRNRNKAPSAEQVEEWASDFEVPAEHASQYRLAFYARDFDAAFDRYVTDLFSFEDEGLEKPDIGFREFARQLLNESPPARPSGSAPRFNEFAFSVYKKLLETLDFDTLDRSVRHSIQLGWTLSSREYSGLQAIILEQVTHALGRRLSDRAKILAATDGADIAQIGLSRYLETLLKDLDGADLPHVLEKDLSEDLKERVRRKSNLYGYYRSLRDPILKQLGPAVPCFVDELAKPEEVDGRSGASVDASRRTSIRRQPNLTALRADELGQIVETLMAERGLGELATLQSYHPDFAPKTNYTDHGLAAGALLGVIFSGARRLANLPGSLGSLLALRGRASRTAALSPELQQRFIAEVIYTILIHNLYPSEFKDDERKRFRTGIGKTAFSFFALFCDNLQHWDRRALINQARGYLPYGVRAEHFDIAVANSRFQITERGPQIEASERDKKLRKQLSDFLEGGAQLIDLSLTEWYPAAAAAD